MLSMKPVGPSIHFTRRVKMEVEHAKSTPTSMTMMTALMPFYGLSIVVVQRKEIGLRNTHARPSV
jgi:hypothetical protein